MKLEQMTNEQISDLVTEARRVLDARSERERAAQAVHDAVAAYATAAGTSVADAWAALSPVPVTPAPNPEPLPDAPDWEQPAGAHDAYNTGDTVTYRGAVYESTMPGNSWSPVAYPQGWRKL